MTTTTHPTTHTSTRPARTRLLATALLGAMTLSLGACYSYQKTYTFTANVDNQAGQPVRAWLATQGPNPSRSSAKVRIGPGDRGQVSLTARADLINLEVDVPGNVSVPQRVEVGPGDSIVKVTNESATSRTRINLSVTENY